MTTVLKHTYRMLGTGGKFLRIRENTTTTTTTAASQAILVVGGSSSRYSLDGSVFTSISIGTAKSIAYNGSKWIAVAYFGSYSYYSSVDGINWSSAVCPIDGGQTVGLVWTGQKWVMGGQKNTSQNVYNSTNGIDWVARYNISNLTTGLVNANGTIVMTPSDGFTYSLDHGDTWARNYNFHPLSSIYGGCYNGSIWVFVGQGTSHSIATYTNIQNGGTGRGKTIFTTRGQAVAWNGTMFVAVGEGTNHVAYSSDGANWTPLGLFTNMTTMYDVAWNGTAWYIVGSTYTSSKNVWTSTNGVDWTAIGNNHNSGQPVYTVATKTAPNLYPPIT